MIDTKFKALMQSPKALIYLDPLKAAMELYNIDTERRVSHFLAQLAHESAGFTRLEENLNYSDQGLARVWPKRFRGADGQPNALAKSLHRKPELIANHVYSNRMGNGDVASGDGWKYRGRGFIQLTGKNNYKTASAAVCGSTLIVESPESVLKPELAALTAAWFWAHNGLNQIADTGDTEGVTRRINGGTVGLEHREKLTVLALATTGATA